MKCFERNELSENTEKIKPLTNVLKRRNAIEAMMGDVKTRSVEKVQMKPKRKIIKTKSVKKQVEINERKNS